MIARSLALASLFVAVVASAQTKPAPPSTQGQKIDGVAAVVDNEVVLQSEVDEQLFLFLQQQQGRPDSAQVQQLRKDILDKLIDDRVIVGEAKRQNLTASEAEIEKNVADAIADTKKRLGSDEAFANELRREGLSEADLRKRASDALARVKKGEPFSRLAQTLSEDPGTAQSGGDLGWFKRGSLDSTFELAAFKVPVGQVSGIVQTPFGYHLIKVEEADPAKGEIHARHILFRVQPSEADANRAKTQIESVRGQAVKGVDFGTLARRYSRYKGPAASDGDLGFLPMTVFSNDFRAALDTLELGEISPPLLNPQGYHLFKVNDRQAERPYLATEIKDDLPEPVRQQKLKEQYDTFVADLRKKAHIEYR
jgi:peptidyl-prolyl cis-trans isomerase SurA